MTLQVVDAEFEATPKEDPKYRFTFEYLAPDNITVLAESATGYLYAFMGYLSVLRTLDSKTAAPLLAIPDSRIIKVTSTEASALN